jgi:dsRNA-specific ribonuclease
MAAKVSRHILEEAWVGDAVLALYARRRILAGDGAIDGGKAARMSSNQFLSSYAEPSHTEAEIGRIYEARGLDAAFDWIEQHLMPLFDRQEDKRSRGRGNRRSVQPRSIEAKLRDLPE